jgi:DNA-binding MarR family transcriptional regulator
MLRSRELRRVILWDRGRLSHQVARMEKRGLVVREECADDARGTMVRMTDAARHYFFDLVSDEEIEVLTAVDERVLAHLHQA